jgi:LysM repeat protein
MQKNNTTKIEAQGGEIVIRNNFDDVAIIPRNLVKKYQAYMKAGCDECIDELVASLPAMSQYAADGTIIPVGSKQTEVSVNPIPLAPISLTTPNNTYNAGQKSSVAPNTASPYIIQKGDTLSGIAKKAGTDVNKLAQQNNIKDINNIQAGKSLSIPYKYTTPLKVKDIPSTYHPNRIIDNYSPAYNYIVQGDKVYYAQKGKDNWVDISDNQTAKTNLYTHLKSKYDLKGYSQEEQQIYTALKNGKYDYAEAYNKKPLSTPKPGILNNDLYVFDKTTKSYKPYQDKDFVTTNPDITSENYKLLRPLDNTTAVNVDTGTIYSTPKGQIIKKSTSYRESLRNATTYVGDTLAAGAEAVFGKTAIEGTADLWETASNGVRRKLAFATGNSDDVEVSNASENKIPLTVKNYYDKYGTSNQNTEFKTNDNSGRIFKQSKINLDQIKLGYRNRGEYKDIDSEGLDITMQSPFLPPKKLMESNADKLTDNSTVIGIDSKGTFVKGKYRDFKNREDVNIAKTFVNRVVSFDEKDNVSITKPDTEHGNKNFQVPIVTVLSDTDGKEVKGSLNVLTKPGKENFYGNVQGGRFIMENPDTKKQYLISGSLKHIKESFKQIKGGSKYVNVYTLDNGTYSRGLSYSDKKLTKERLKKYDLENTGGGNGLYIISNTAPTSEFKTEYYDSPNVRKDTDKSYTLGHALKNERKVVVLHYTAYENSPKGDADLHAQYMTPNRDNSHVVILGDGTKRIYASPEQVTFHAGESKWKGRDNVNDFGIGVEFQNSGIGKLTDAQVKSGAEYITDLMDKYNLKLEDVITHKMIAPKRKQDLTDVQYQQVLNELIKRGYK